MQKTDSEFYKVIESDMLNSIPGGNTWYGTNERMKDITICLSPFTFLFKKKNYCALYHSLNLKKIFGGESLNRIYKMAKREKHLKLSDLAECLDDDESENGLQLLINNGFIIPFESDHYYQLKIMQKDIQFQKPMIGLLYLLITNDCNLRCRYCMIESENRKPETFQYSHMTKETARSGIDLFADIFNKRNFEARVIYYGGEPLLNPDTLYDSITYLKEKERNRAFGEMVENLDISLLCNGTLMTDEIALMLKKNSVTAAVSIDGMKRHHDMMRKKQSGMGSWDDSIRGYNIIKKHLGKCGISCTLGPHNYLDIEEIAEFFATRLDISGIGFNIIRGLPPGNDIEIPGEEVTKYIIKAYKIFRRFGIYEDRIMRKINSFIYEEPYFHDCAGYGKQIAVCADGSVGPCHIAADDHRFCWGKAGEKNLQKEILESNMTKEWCQRSAINIKACIHCIGLGLCGGGCAEAAFIKKGNTFDLDECFCGHCKLLVEWMMDDLAAKLIEAGKLPRKSIIR